jgi:hypothetical protein
MKVFYFLLFTFYLCKAQAQYAPQVGMAGNTAISKTGSQFVGWATGCTVRRGYMDIAQPGLGYASAGDSSLAIGIADGSVVSLGDSGIAVLTFSNPIYNGPGPDFAVFENGFLDPNNDTLAFLELGFVEVSSDGVNYFRFPATSLTPDNVQADNDTYLNAANLNNLAGKYIGGYGTPFDLDELANMPGLDVNNITHVRIIDVIGSINGHSSYDSAGRIINDPYPTAFPTGGFDLDAVGAINQLGTGISPVTNNADIKVYPNPATDKLMVSVKDMATATLVDMTGKELISEKMEPGVNVLPVAQYSGGMYYLILCDTNGNRWAEKVTKL